MKSERWRKIGDIAEELGVTARTLRFYEEEGLITACRTQGGTRLYSDEHVGRFKAILTLAAAGAPLLLIRRLATIRAEYTTGAESSRQVEIVLQQLIATFISQMATLNRLTSEANSALAALAGCHSCRKRPSRNGCTKCAINELADVNDLLALIWEPHECPS